MHTDGQRRQRSGSGTSERAHRAADDLSGMWRERRGEPSEDLVSWGAHGLTQPEWSHRDGSSLCPVIGPSGGYEPAQPVVAEPDEREAGQ